MSRKGYKPEFSFASHCKQFKRNIPGHIWQWEGVHVATRTKQAESGRDLVHLSSDSKVGAWDDWSSYRCQ